MKVKSNLDLSSDYYPVFLIISAKVLYNKKQTKPYNKNTNYKFKTILNEKTLPNMFQLKIQINWKIYHDNYDITRKNQFEVEIHNYHWKMNN